MRRTTYVCHFYKDIYVIIIIQHIFLLSYQIIEIHKRYNNIQQGVSNESIEIQYHSYWAFDYMVRKDQEGQQLIA